MEVLSHGERVMGQNGVDVTVKSCAVNGSSFYSLNTEAGKDGLTQVELASAEQPDVIIVTAGYNDVIEGRMNFGWRV